MPREAEESGAQPIDPSQRAVQGNVATPGDFGRRRSQTGAEQTAIKNFWMTHFGDMEQSVSFDRVRSALETDLGEISTVDLQLLRLELMDERGRLSRGALSRIMRDESGALHATVSDAVKDLLKQARAQLEVQVEARMQQALSSRPGLAMGGESPRAVPLSGRKPRVNVMRPG